MRKELTPDKKDWIAWDNSLFKKGDILVIHERVVVQAHPDFPRSEVGKVLAEPGDELVVVGADCIGCFVKNKSHPERNFVVPEGVHPADAWAYDCWMCQDVSATLVRED